MGIRWAQTAALAVPGTYQAVILDTPAANGWIHSPYKAPVGARLARQALATAYHRAQPNPTVASAKLLGNSAVVVPSTD